MSTALKKSPLSRVKDEFGGKDKLVDKIVGVLDAGDESKDELRKRLLGVANIKLIRLHGVATKTKQAGGHDKLAVATAEQLGRAKDKDYVGKLESFSNGRLIDMLTTAERRKASVAANATAAGAPAKAARQAAKAVTAEKTAAAAKAKAAAKKAAPKVTPKKTSSKRRG